MPGNEEYNSTTIDTEEVKGDSNDIENKANKEDNEDVNEQGGDANVDGGTEDNQVGENDQEQEDTNEVQEESTESESQVTSVDDLNTKIENLQKQLEDKLKAPPVEKQQQQEERPIELTEEQWVEKEEQWGVGRSAIKNMTAQNVQVYNKIVEHVESLLNQRLGGMESESVFSTFSQQKGFQDAPRYKGAMTEFLSKYNQSDRRNPELLQMAYFYAKGRSSDKNIRQAHNNGNKNKQIIGVGRPATPGGSGKRGTTKPLSKVQQDTASRFGMSHDEYRKYQGNGKMST